MTWPAEILIVLIAAAAVMRIELLFALFGLTAAFGDLSLLPPAITNLPPQPVCAALIVARVLAVRHAGSRLVALAADCRRLGFLSLFAIYAAFTAIVLPRLLAGSVLVIRLDAPQAGPQPLAPSFSNFTQLAYVLVSIGMAFAAALLGGEPRYRRAFLLMVVLSGASLGVSGLLDMVALAAGQSALLAPLHNAGYALLADVDFAGVARVVGFMPEASSFGAAAVSVMSILVLGWPVFRSVSGPVGLGLVVALLGVMASLSTSSTAYVGEAVLLGTLVLRQAGVMLRTRSADMRFALRVMSALVLLGAGAGIVYAFAPSVMQTIGNVLNQALVLKLDSASYMERSHWTEIGLAAFADSDGLGVGIGSLRTSNWFVNLLASTGLVGTGLFAAWIIATLCYVRRLAALPGAAARYSFLWALLPIGVMMASSNTTPDPGALVMSLLGLAVTAAPLAGVDAPRHKVGPAATGSAGTAVQYV